MQNYIGGGAMSRGMYPDYSVTECESRIGIHMLVLRIVFPSHPMCLCVEIYYDCLRMTYELQILFMALIVAVCGAGVWMLAKIRKDGKDREE